MVTHTVTLSHSTFDADRRETCWLLTCEASAPRSGEPGHFAIDIAAAGDRVMDGDDWVREFRIPLDALDVLREAAEMLAREEDFARLEFKAEAMRERGL